MAFNARITGLRLSRQGRRGRKVTQTIYEALEREFRRGVNTFAREAIKRTAVDTGMAASSLIPAGRVFRRALPTIVVKRDPDPNGYYDINARRRPQFKGPNAGLRVGEKAFQLNLGSQRRPVFQFNYRILIFHQFLEEFGLANFSRASRATEFGLAAQVRQLRNNWPIVARDVFQNWFSDQSLRVQALTGLEIS